MAIEKLPNYQDINDIITCGDYSFSAHHKSILKRMSNHIKQYNPTKGGYIIECNKEDLIKIFKLLNK